MWQVAAFSTNNCNASQQINIINTSSTMDLTFYHHLPSLTLPSDKEFSTCEVEHQKSPKIDFKGLTLKQYFEQTHKASNAQCLRTLQDESSAKAGRTRLYKRIASKLCINTPKGDCINKTEMSENATSQRDAKYDKNDQLCKGKILHSNIFAFANQEPSELLAKNSLNLISKLHKCYRLSQAVPKTKEASHHKRVSLTKQHEPMQVGIKSPFKIREGKKDHRKVRNYSEFKERVMERSGEKEGRLTELLKKIGTCAQNTTHFLDCLRVTKQK